MLYITKRAKDVFHNDPDSSCGDLSQMPYSTTLGRNARLCGNVGRKQDFDRWLPRQCAIPSIPTCFC